MSRAIGEVAALGRGDGVALGTSNRPRRCAAVGEADDAGIGVEVAAAAGANVAAVRGVIVGCGVEVVGAADAVAAADGAAVAVVDVDVGVVSLVVALVAAAAFTNFFGGGFAGGAASDFIFRRVFFASSWFAIAAQPRSTAVAAMVCFTVGGRSFATGSVKTGAATTIVSPRTTDRDSPETSTFTLRSSRYRCTGSRLCARTSS